MDEREELLEEIKKLWHWKTVPIVLEKSGATLRLVGGFDDLKEELEDV